MFTLYSLLIARCSLLFDLCSLLFGTDIALVVFDVVVIVVVVVDNRHRAKNDHASFRRLLRHLWCQLYTPYG